MLWKAPRIAMASASPQKCHHESKYCPEKNAEKDQTRNERGNSHEEKGDHNGGKKRLEGTLTVIPKAHAHFMQQPPRRVVSLKLYSFHAFKARNLPVLRYPPSLKKRDQLSGLPRENQTSRPPVSNQPTTLWIGKRFSILCESQKSTARPGNQPEVRTSKLHQPFRLVDLIFPSRCQEFRDSHLLRPTNEQSELRVQAFSPTL